jgi:phage-related protein
MAWVVETLNAAVDAELQALPADMRARFAHIARLIEEFGLERVHEPHVRHLRGPLLGNAHEGPRRVSRAIYVSAKSQRVVVVRVFVKKTESTPARDIDLALQRAKGILK